MKRLRAGGFVAVTWTALVLANCGGESFSGGESGRGGESGSSAGGGASGSDPSGGSSSDDDDAGGSVNTGGTAGTGLPTGGASGTGSGGAGNGGTSAARGGAGGTTGGVAGTTAGTGMTGGAAGAGGEPGFCLLPPDPGPCRAAMLRFAFNPVTGVCHPFTYGGCEGNANNFQSIEECYGACAGQGEADYAACENPTDCTLVPSRCCGCGEGDLGTMVAVNVTKAAAFSGAMLCNVIDCQWCPVTPNPWLGATCRAGRCLAFDARETELTECSAPEDCRFRAGLNCCEGCTAERSSFIALNRDADLQDWLCGDAPVGCPGCIPIVPPNLSTICSNSRCGVLDAELPQ